MATTQRTERTKRETRVKPTARIPVGGYRDKLTVRFNDTEHEQKYQHRWVLDTTEQGPRIVQFKEAGYEFVPASEVSVGQTHVYDSTDSGSIVRRPADGIGQHLYLMRQPMEFYLEDQEAKQKAVDDTEEGLKGHQGLEGAYGEVKLSRK